MTTSVPELPKVPAMQDDVGSLIKNIIYYAMAGAVGLVAALALLLLLLCKGDRKERVRTHRNPSQSVSWSHRPS
ncbi:hypothetical protein PAPYR_5813 [Paratrimastix pyriformis]|uniref:Uncharacterized protein n=1 Tax=Paratrimastix pyriformis TaxID=342808 RepID=A0ABQ8UGP3_9EUKA|nr:hypothetical protein PAPYR_5813 [Paratrimastix pyriformis]